MVQHAHCYISQIPPLMQTKYCLYQDQPNKESLKKKNFIQIIMYSAPLNWKTQGYYIVKRSLTQTYFSSNWWEGSKWPWKAPKIYLCPPKINFITIITLKGIDKVRTEKNEWKTVWTITQQNTKIFISACKMHCNAQEANWELVIMLVFINLWSDK